MAVGNENFAGLAAASRAAAAAEVLENVRQKHLTSAATWEALARAKSKMDALRLRRIAERTASPWSSGEAPHVA